jgi:hypothetical protein
MSLLCPAVLKCETIESAALRSLSRGRHAFAKHAAKALYSSAASYARALLPDARHVSGTVLEKKLDVRHGLTSQIARSIPARRAAA